LTLRCRQSTGSWALCVARPNARPVMYCGLSVTTAMVALPPRSTSTEWKLHAASAKPRESPARACSCSMIARSLATPTSVTFSATRPAATGS
jgi:hypothetical protein